MNKQGIGGEKARERGKNMPGGTKGGRGPAELERSRTGGPSKTIGKPPVSGASHPGSSKAPVSRGERKGKMKLG